MSQTKGQLINQQTKNNDNRARFANEMNARTKEGQRLGMFSQGMPLTVGDASTNYQCDRRPKEEVGRVRNFSNTRGKMTTQGTFNKLQSNAIGDDYNDSKPLGAFLRSEAGSKTLSNSIFKPNGGHKLVRNSEYQHMKEFDIAQKGLKNTPINFMARLTSDSFQKKLKYTEDAFERKEDHRKLDYQRRAALILDKGKPYTTSVTQHGTFDPFRKTYGTEGNFATKPKWSHDVPQFGPFRIGNLPKHGYNKAIGQNPNYIEDPVEDTVTYQKNVNVPIWKEPTHSTTTAFKQISTTYKNTAGMLNKQAYNIGE